MKDISKCVLYVCTNNKLRSVIAQKLTQKHFGKHIYSISAGVRYNSEPPIAFAVQVMHEINIDITDHQPRKIDEIHDMIDLVVSLSPQSRHLSLDFADANGCNIEHWMCSDPSLTQGNREQIISSYRDLRDELEKKILHYFCEK